MSSNRQGRSWIVETADSVNREALRLLSTDPAGFFRRTHKRVPFGYTPLSAGSRKGPVAGTGEGSQE